MKLTGPTVLIMLAVAIALGAFLGSRNRTTAPRPLYGKASLGSEEKWVLANPFPDYPRRNYARKAYTVAMICLKHRLTFTEVKELVSAPVRIRDITKDGNGYELIYHFHPGWDGDLRISFDNNGNLTEGHYHCGQYRLPPMKAITPNTPIETPPLPVKEDALSDAVLEFFRKRPQSGERVEYPPDFHSLTYSDAKLAVQVTTHAVQDGHRPLVADFSSKVVEQLRNEKTSDDKKAAAIYLLSKVAPQDTNSIAVAIERIDLKVNVPPSEPRWVTPWSSYPARDALLRIGEASVDLIVQQLPVETNALRRQLLCAVVSTFGRTNWTTAWQPKSAIDQLQRLRATESEQSRQHNIDEALGLLIDNKVDVNIGWSGYLGE